MANNMKKVDAEVVVAAESKRIRRNCKPIRLIIEPGKDRLDFSEFISQVMDFKPKEDRA